ncbi:MAG TPA: helix-turn-helix domain-containing protein [Vicinamibacteria bacterium]|jgi:curved DNA-binding protein CbpA
MFERPSDQNHYQVLEISERASAEEIQSAYERAKEIYSCDSVVSSSILAPEERRQILERVTEAYHTLIAEESRRLYDRSLAEPAPSRNPENGSSPAAPATRVGYVAGTSPSSSPAQAYPRLVGLRPEKAGEAGEALEHVKIALGVKEEATGEFLRKAREASGVDLRAISHETKIGVTMLGYIEEERLDRLPVEVYLRNFVRQYAHCLGLEDERVARSYVARIRRLQSKGRDTT